MKTPFVSVVIPTYNRKESVLQAIKSVQEQTFLDIEILIGDDGSTDGTKDEIFSLHDPRIIYNWAVNSGGPSAPRNWGMQSAKGKYIAFLDSDDTWLPQKLEKQIAFMEKQPELGLSHTYMLDAETENLLKRNDYKNGYVSEELFMSTNFIATSTVILKRHVIKKAGYMDIKLPVCQDFDFWLRIARHYPIYLLREPLTKHMVGKGIATDPYNMIEDILVIIKKCRDSGLVPKELAEKREHVVYQNISKSLGGAKRTWLKFFWRLFTRKQKAFKKWKVLKHVFFS